MQVKFPISLDSSVQNITLKLFTLFRNEIVKVDTSMASKESIRKNKGDKNLFVNLEEFNDVSEIEEAKKLKRKRKEISSAPRKK